MGGGLRPAREERVSVMATATTQPGTVATGAAAWPTLRDVFAARRLLAPMLTPSPLVQSPELSDLLGCELHLKCENLLPTGAFKIRGGLALLSELAIEGVTTVVTASTGNHGQSIAAAARRFGIAATIFVPHGANPRKVAALRRWGAAVEFAGVDFDESMTAAVAAAERTGATFIHPANERRLIAGVGTFSLEIIEAVPDLDVLFVPVGSGTGAAGACIAARGIHSTLRVIGVQASGAPAAHDTWRARALRATPTADTVAEGVATRSGQPLPAAILWEHLADFRLVSDQAMARAILTLLRTTGQLAEHAGAAGLAAAYAMRDELRGKRVAVVLSGGNLTLETLSRILTTEQAW